MFVGVLILGLTLISLSALTIYNFKQSSLVLHTESLKHINIKSLMLDLNRIMAILKDKASGFDSRFSNYSTLN